MAFFKNFKRSFGFSDPEDDYDYGESIDITTKKRDINSESSFSFEQPISHTANSTCESKHKSPINISTEERLKEMHLQIFDGVVSIFNKSLPDFLKSSVDKEAQKQYIFDSLDKSLRDYILNISTEARRVCEDQWDKERSKIMKEMIEIKSKYREIESTRDDWKRQQLSAERQKRALSARLHDLEIQVASLEAEKEQYSLENKSLVNKLKVSNLKGENEDYLQEEIKRLQLALNEARSGASGFEYDIDSIIADKDNIISQLQKQITDIQEQASNIIQNNDYTEKLQELTKENETLKNSIEQIKAKEEIADAMINDLQEKASTSIKKYEESEKQRTLMECHVSSSNEEIERLNQLLAQLSKELDEKNEELIEAQNGLKMIESIQSEMDKFEQIKKKKDSKILALQKDLSVYKSQVLELEKDAESLKSTIENNLYNQAISEDRLKKEIERLKKLSDDYYKEGSSEIKISAIDESLDNADWLIATPPEGTQMRSASNSSDENFGYQEPVKKSAPDNEAQMLLW